MVQDPFALTMPSKGGRNMSGPWGRLKPVEQDVLESMGLPSKGDNRCDVQYPH
jgi:hypothetical protein